MTAAEHERHDRFLRLFLEHEESLRGFIRAITHNREQAREVMQEVAAVLWRKFDALESDQDFRRWAFGVARFEALASARDNARERHTFSDELLEMLADDAASEVDEMEAERKALEHCLEKLPAPQRELVNAAYERGTRIDELATRLGRTAMSLYKVLHRIRMTLADCAQRELAKDGSG